MATRLITRLILWTLPILFIGLMLFSLRFRAWFDSWFEAAAEASLTAAHFDEIATEEARAAGINPSWVRAVMWVESKHDQFAVSPRGAMGLMQLMPATIKRCGLTNNGEAFKPRQNIKCGVKELKGWLDKYGSLEAATQAYNGGSGCLGKCAESVQHSRKVFAALARDAR